ncbi:MAG: hypothetical protein ABIP48_30140, partial [Planctomycetota bacterium]
RKRGQNYFSARKRCFSRQLVQKIVLTPFSIRYFASFALNWMYSITDSYTPSDPWRAAGTTSHELYVTWAKPTADPLYHTLVHLGTTNADGKDGTVEAPVLADIWSEFTDLDVRRRDGELMVYYGPTIDPLTVLPHELTTAGLLEHKAGRCQAWAYLFHDVLRAQGMASGETRAIIPKPLAGHTTVGFDLLASLIGQGNTNPPDQFQNHMVVWLNGTIYDPSYGKPHAGLAAWEDASLLKTVYKRLSDDTIIYVWNTPAEETQWAQ